MTAAAEDFEQSAAVGDPHAIFNLGYMFLTGNGKPKDSEEAVKHFELAAAMGVPAALNALGVAYFNGMGVPRDKVKAISYLRRAAAEVRARMEHHRALECTRLLRSPFSNH